MLQIAPGTQGCPCPCLTGVEMTLRLRGCRASRPCPSEDPHPSSSTIQHVPPRTTPTTSHTCHVRPESFLAVAAASYTGHQRSTLPSPYSSRPVHHEASGPVLPSSHLLDHLSVKAPHVSIDDTQPSLTRNTLDIPQSSLMLSSRSLMEGDHHSSSRGHDHKSKGKGKPWSLPRVPKRPGRFSSRRNRSATNASMLSTVTRPVFHRPSPRTSTSHPDFREFHF